MSKVDEAVMKIKADLDWRGPSGKTMGHVMISRDQALALIAWIETKGHWFPPDASGNISTGR